MADILIVEDDRIVAWHIKETLEKLGHRVIASVVSGASAIQTAADLEPDIVLMDIRLKGDIDGVTAAEQIYTQLDIPVVYLTAHTDETTLHRAKMSAPFGYLVKPLREQDLQTTIAVSLHRHQLEQRSKHLQQWFARALTSIGDGAIATDLEGTVTFINPAAESLTGWQQQEALGQPIAQVLDLIQENTREAIENPVFQAIQQGIGVTLPSAALLRAKDGTERAVGDTATPIKNSQGDIIGGMLVFQDITERRQLEATLRQTQERLAAQLQTQTEERQQALSQLAVGMICIQLLQHVFEQIARSVDEGLILQTILQDLGRLLEADYCWVSLYDKDQMIATVTREYLSDRQSYSLAIGTQVELRSYPQFYLPLLQKNSWIAPNLELLPDVYQPLLDSSQSELLICPICEDELVTGEVGILTTGKSLWCQLKADLISQTIGQAAIALRQVRAYRVDQAVEELEVLTQLKNSFLSSVSHELRTPLTNMRMAVEMLQRIVRSLRSADPDAPIMGQSQHLLWERLERYLHVLYEEWQREFNLVSDLLNFQTNDAPAGPLLLTPIDVQQWLPQVGDRFAVRIQRQQQTLTYRIEPYLPHLVSHLPTLDRIVTELINNACKFTPQGHHIMIGAHAEDGQLIIAITNTGIEIMAEEQEKIFQPFHRVSQADPWSHRGIGLGLALVKKLVKRLDGTITVKSDAGATTFTVSLPCTS